MMKRIEFISFEEFKKIYQAEKRKEMKLALMLGFGSGLRISEIIGLKKLQSRCCDAEIEKRLIEIDKIKVKRYFCLKCNKMYAIKDLRRICKKGVEEWTIPPLTSDKINLETHQIRLDIAKGDKWRVTVTPPLMNAEYLKLLPLKMERRTLQNRFDVLTKKVLGKKMSFHILRHGFGNYQANVLRLPLPIVQQLMGHSRLDTTGIYTKVNPEQAISSAWKAMTGEK